MAPATRTLCRSIGSVYGKCRRVRRCSTSSDNSPADTRSRTAIWLARSHRRRQSSRSSSPFTGLRAGSRRAPRYGIAAPTCSVVPARSVASSAPRARNRCDHTSSVRQSAMAVLDNSRIQRRPSDVNRNSMYDSVDRPPSRPGSAIQHIPSSKSNSRPWGPTPPAPIPQR